MISDLERAIERVRQLPDAEQVRVAEVLDLMAAQHDGGGLTPEQVAGVKSAQAQVAAGRLASDADVTSFFARFRSS